MDLCGQLVGRLLANLTELLTNGLKLLLGRCQPGFQVIVGIRCCLHRIQFLFDFSVVIQDFGDRVTILMFQIPDDH